MTGFIRLHALLVDDDSLAQVWRDLPESGRRVPVDPVMEQLNSLLNEGDIVIDGGNSWFEDTRRREKSHAEAVVKDVAQRHRVC